ncbi:MAG TPA: hypothetical protein DDZ89_21790 [Clostridiales bacterium]|nr:hypothetical protein [Clostridiales bacterium]
MDLRDFGYVWEGQGFDPGVPPSVLGVGDGCRLLKMNKAVVLFHPNNPRTLSRLTHCDEVVCDISKWKVRSLDPVKGLYSNAIECYVDGHLETVLEEVRNVVSLKKQFPNITGVIHDDLIGLCKRCGLNAKEYGEVVQTISQAGLKLWLVFYAHELDEIETKWRDFKRYADVVHFWVWKSEDLFYLDEYMKRCRKAFPDKPINLGVYLRDYHYRRSVPTNRLLFEMEKIKGYIQDDVIQGFSILGTITMDTNPEGVKAIADFLDQAEIY